MAEAASPGRSTEQKGAGDARTGALFRHSRTQRKPRSGEGGVFQTRSASVKGREDVPRRIGDSIRRIHKGSA